MERNDLKPFFWPGLSADIMELPMNPSVRGPDGEYQGLVFRMLAVIFRITHYAVRPARSTTLVDTREEQEIAKYDDLILRNGS